MFYFGIGKAQKVTPNPLDPIKPSKPILITPLYDSILNSKIQWPETKRLGELILNSKLMKKSKLRKLKFMHYKKTPNKGKSCFATELS